MNTRPLTVLLLTFAWPLSLSAMEVAIEGASLVDHAAAVDSESILLEFSPAASAQLITAFNTLPACEGPSQVFCDPNLYVELAPTTAEQRHLVSADNVASVVTQIRVLLEDGKLSEALKDLENNGSMAPETVEMSNYRTLANIEKLDLRPEYDAAYDEEMLFAVELPDPRSLLLVLLGIPLAVRVGQ